MFSSMCCVTLSREEKEFCSSISKEKEARFELETIKNEKATVLPLRHMMMRVDCCGQPSEFERMFETQTIFRTHQLSNVSEHIVSSTRLCRTLAARCKASCASSCHFFPMLHILIKLDAIRTVPTLHLPSSCLSHCSLRGRGRLLCHLITKHSQRVYENKEIKSCIPK